MYGSSLEPRLFVMYMWFFVAKPTSQIYMYTLLEIVKTRENFRIKMVLVLKHTLS